MPPPPPETVTLPYATPQLENDLLLPGWWLNRVIDLLQEKRRIVLYGPPGTGKTYLAHVRRLTPTDLQFIPAVCG